MNIPSISYSSLIAVLREANISYSFIDANAENLSLKEIMQRIQEIDPEYVGVSSNIAFAYQSCVLCGKIRLEFPNISVIMGGPWVSATYDYVLRNRFADIVIIGEGDHTIIEILKEAPESLNSIKGIAFWDRTNKKVILTPKRPIIDDLNTLPFPKWEDFPPSSKYFVYHRHKNFYPILTTRGCPYACINCTKIVHGYKVRSRSIEHVISEVKYLKDTFNCEELLIEDDFFNYDLERSKEFFNTLIKENLHFSIELLGVRADNITEEIVILMKKAGVYKVSVGIESATPRVLKVLGKKLDLVKANKAIDLFSAHGIIVLGFFMIGIPTETTSEILNTIRFASNSNLDLAYISRIIAFPGTKLFDIITEGREITDDYLKPVAIDYLDIKNQFDPKKQKTLNTKLKRLFLLFYFVFYLNPRRIFRYLRKVKSLMEFYQMAKNTFVMLTNTLFAIFER